MMGAESFGAECCDMPVAVTNDESAVQPPRPVLKASGRPGTPRSNPEGGSNDVIVTPTLELSTMGDARSNLEGGSDFDHCPAPQKMRSPEDDFRTLKKWRIICLRNLGKRVRKFERAPKRFRRDAHPEISQFEIFAAASKSSRRNDDTNRISDRISPIYPEIDADNLYRHRIARHSRRNSDVLTVVARETVDGQECQEEKGQGGPGGPRGRGDR